LAQKPNAYLSKRDVFSELKFNQILLSVHNFNGTIGIDLSDVSGVEPSDTILFPEGFRGQGIVFIVSSGNTGTSDHDLSSRVRLISHEVIAC